MAENDWYSDEQNSYNDDIALIDQGGGNDNIDRRAEIDANNAAVANSPTPQGVTEGSTPAGGIGNVTTQGPTDGQPEQPTTQPEQTLTPENQKTYDTIMKYADITRDMFGIAADASDGKIGGGSITDFGDSANKAMNINPSGGEDTGFMKDLMKGILDPKNSNLTNLGANFLAGMMNYKSKAALTGAQVNSLNKNAEATMMNAQTAQAAENLKQAGSKAMGLIHMPKAAPIQYTNLLAERRARSGAK